MFDILFYTVITILFIYIFNKWIQYIHEPEQKPKTPVNEDINCKKYMSVMKYPWKYSQTLGPQLTITGHSRAAERTGFYWNTLGCYFDAGIQASVGHPFFVFLTHGHADHSVSLPMMNIDGNNKTEIFVGSEIESHVKKYITSMICLNDYKISENKLKSIVITPVQPYNLYELNHKNRQFIMEVFKCYHSVPTVGYGFYEKRKMLKDEYKHLKDNKAEISKLIKDGININQFKNIPIVCYLGDTNINVFYDNQNANIFKFPFIMVECTFLCQDTVNDARATRHIHFEHIYPIILSHPENTFVLYHFSCRYTDTYINEFFIEKNIKNVIPWLG